MNIYAHPSNKSVQNKFFKHPHVRYPKNSENSPSHSRYFRSHRTSGKLSPTPTFLQQHSLWTNTHQLYPQPAQVWKPDKYFVETCINTSTHNGFVTKEFVKIDEDSQTWDYTIIYIKFQGQTPPFTTLNQDIFERLLPRPFPQVGDILSEEEDSESEPELIA